MKEVAFCREDEHDAAAQNLQNEKCGNRATWTVIFEDSVDSAALQSLQPLQSPPPAPSFTVVQRMKRVVCLILDVSGSMAGSRILRQRQAATHFLQYIIEDQAVVGIVTFSNEAYILKKLTHIDNDITRKELIKSLPTTAGGGTYICKGLFKGLEVLREDNLDALGDEIIFLTDGEASDNLTTCVPGAIQSGAIIHTIALGTSAAQALRQMADKTGGKFIIATDDLTSNMLVDAFASLTIPTGDYTKEPVQCCENADLVSEHREDPHDLQHADEGPLEYRFALLSFTLLLTSVIAFLDEKLETWWAVTRRRGGRGPRGPSVGEPRDYRGKGKQALSCNTGVDLNTGAHTTHERPHTVGAFKSGPDSGMVDLRAVVRSSHTPLVLSAGEIQHCHAKPNAALSSRSFNSREPGKGRTFMSHHRSTEPATYEDDRTSTPPNLQCKGHTHSINNKWAASLTASCCLTASSMGKAAKNTTQHHSTLLSVNLTAKSQTHPQHSSTRMLYFSPRCKSTSTVFLCLLTAGDWKYSILSGRSQSLTITVTSQAADADVPPIIVKAHVNQQVSDGSKPMIVFAEVSQNYRSIVNAEVWATLEPEKGTSEIIELLDNGAGADAFKDDGIYSRYFTKLVKGRTSLKVRVRNKDGQSRFTLYGKSDVVNDKVKPEPSVVEQPLVVGNFTRTATGESFEVSFTSGKKTPNYPPNKITDLKAEIKEDTVLLIWTAPGEDLDLGTAKSYEIRWSNDHEMLRLNFSDAFLVNTSAVSPQESGSVEQHSFNMIIQNGATIYFAIRSEDKDAVKSKISNIVQVTKILPARGLNFIIIIIFVCVATISLCFVVVVVKRRHYFHKIQIYRRFF
nr:calcium-activated chloride channel regulator 4A-like [Misgurnus anguillicaudatus]